MPARRTEKPLHPPNLTILRDEAARKINEQISIGKSVLDLMNQSSNQEAFRQAMTDEDKWRRYVADMLKRCFDNELYSQEFDSANSVGGVMYIEDFFDERKSHADDLAAKIAVLESIRDRLPDIKESTDLGHSKIASKLKPIQSRNVFVVHGHESGIKEESARFLSKLKLIPIILHEQANEGQTIIEKIERHTRDVAFAVVIMTPDDEGRSKEKPEELKPRARQNVIYELGYLHGKLGRSKVAVLYIQGVEILSDLHGVLYIPYDDGGAWKLKLALEIKKSGISVDLNDAV